MKEKIAGFLLRRWQYKLLALLAAFVLWFYIVNEQNLSFSITCQVEYTNFPTALKITNKPPNSLEIALEGRKDILTNIKKSEVKVFVNLAKAKEGMNNYNITTNMVKNLPGGVLIKDITPAIVNIELQRPKPTPAPEPPAAALVTPSASQTPEAHNGKTVR